MTLGAFPVGRIETLVYTWFRVTVHMLREKLSSIMPISQVDDIVD